MCLGEVARVEQVCGDATALVRRSDGRPSAVSLITLADPVSPGDWLVCHSGFALALVSSVEADAAIRIRSSTKETP